MYDQIREDTRTKLKIFILFLAKALSIQKIIVTLQRKSRRSQLLLNGIGDTTMATAIKAIPTLKGKEAREFLRRAEEAEHDFKGNKNKDQHPLCMMAHEILSKAGMTLPNTSKLYLT